MQLLAVAKGLEERAATDALTGISNRFEFNETLRREMARAKRHKTPLSLIIYDIDHFKRVNDTHGHLVGDSLLIEITELVSRHLRPADRLARWGGEEFVILTPGCDQAAAYQAAERLSRTSRIRGFADGK
jgi:diguanylate cyclase (GGDEF)-like protein